MLNFRTLLAALGDAIVDAQQGFAFESSQGSPGSCPRVTLVGRELRLVLSASNHHLDIPWQVTTIVERDGRKVGELERMSDPDYSYDLNPRYEILPNESESENVLRLSTCLIEDLKQLTR